MQDLNKLTLVLCVNQYTFHPAAFIKYYTCKGELYAIGRTYWIDVEEQIDIVNYSFTTLKLNK